MISIAGPIHTARLIVRPFTERDLDDLHAMHSDPSLTTYLYWDPRSREQVWDVLQRKIPCVRIDEDGSALALAVEHAGTVIGDISLLCVNQRFRQGEIGFIFNGAYHGRGFATEAARAVLELGFSTVGFHRISGRCDARNTASARLMERLGMRREACLVENEMVKGEWTSELIYAMLAREWAEQQRRAP